MKIKMFHHVCIQTTDYKASLEFYKDFLGFELIKESPGFHGREYNSWLRAGGCMIELQTPKENEEFIPWNKSNSGPVHIAFVVEDVQAMYTFLKSKGYSRFKVKNGLEVYEVEGSPLFKVKAPEGTEIEIRDNTWDSSEI